MILTKPLGTGIVGTAIKFGRASQPLIDVAVRQMTTLNKAAAEAIANLDGVHACTDITGFGLIGHGSEMAVASGVTLEIETASVPVLPGALDLVGFRGVGAHARRTSGQGNRESVPVPPKPTNGPPSECFVPSECLARHRWRARHSLGVKHSDRWLRWRGR